MSEENDYPKGGEEGYEGDGPNLRYDEFVGRIVQDPNEPPGVTLLSGYLGSSSEEGHVRLYLDEELGRYVEIPEKVIRHTQELSPEQSPLGGSLVWIDRDAELLHGAAGSERRKATFFEGQIAQDYLGGGVVGGSFAEGGVTTQSRACIGPPPTSVGPSCGPSRLRPCIPQTELPGCRTRTGILCTRFGASCQGTIHEPNFTVIDPGCRVSVFLQCPSINAPCVTQNQSYCVASGFYGCVPIDFTIYEQPGWQQFGQQAPFAGGGFGGGAQGFAVFGPPDTAPAVCRTLTGDLCPSRYIVSCQSRVPNDCVLGIVSRDIPCPPPTRSGPRCFFVSHVAVCSDTRTGPGCVIGTVNCPTRDIKCRVSQVAVCDSRLCEVQSVACGVDPAGGGAQPRGFEAEGFAALQTQTADCGIPQTRLCPSAVDACPTRFNCPSRFTPCQSMLVRCQSQLDACPTRFNCPSLPNGCPGHTRFGACETYGPCPSAVDACPTRLGCYNTAVCGESIACHPGGGGGFDPGGFGWGGFGGGF